MNAKGSALLGRIYRALLRSSASAVRFSRPAAKNTRRYLRDEIAHELQLANTSSTHARLHNLAKLTTAFHLASALSPSYAASQSAVQNASTGTAEPRDVPRPTRAQLTLPHRVVANLSSLTYHHLSPHTPMKSFAHMRVKSIKRRRKSISSFARVLNKVDPTSNSEDETSSSDLDLLGTTLSEDDMVLNARHTQVDFLIPSAKPLRGPLSQKLPNWDGQDYSKYTSPGVIALLQQDLNTVQNVLAHFSSANSAKMPRGKLESLREQEELLKGNIKGKLRHDKNVATQASLQATPIDMLANLINAAQDSEHIWLGKQRWLVRQRNGFLPP